MTETTMTANDVLIDILEDNRQRLHYIIGQCSPECLHWSPDGEANSIAATTWHMGRVLDMFLTQQVKGEPIEQERWFVGGWAEKTGYDPRGIGMNGWGTIQGYTPEEVQAMPEFSAEHLLGYIDDMYAATTTYFQETPIAAMLQPAPGFDGNYSQYLLMRSQVTDNIRHLGEIFAIKAMWDRQNKAE